jgi:hypothetical protein
MRRPGADLEEKPEPRVALLAEAQKGDSMRQSGRGLTRAAIEKDSYGLSVLYNFCSDSPCSVGYVDPSGLWIDGRGTLYGNAYNGSRSNNGFVFSVDARNVLSVTESGPGRVTSSPAGIDCRRACSAKFAPGTAVTLTAIPDAGAYFAGWAKDCGAGGGCTVTLDSDREVYAVFQAAQSALSVSTIGSGTVTASEGGIKCGKTCSARLPGGSTVMLSASPSPGWQFAGWSGACAGARDCKITVHGSTHVAAVFDRQETTEPTHQRH